MSSRRLSPKEIKHDIREDEVQNFLYRTLEYLQDNPKQVLGIAGGVLALVLAIVGVTGYLDRQKTVANEQLVAALKIYQAPVEEEGAKPDDPREPSFASEDEGQSRAKEALQAVADDRVGGDHLVGAAALGRSPEQARAQLGESGRCQQSASEQQEAAEQRATFGHTVGAPG